MPYDPIERWEWEGGAFAAHAEPPDEANPHERRGQSDEPAACARRLAQAPARAAPSPIGESRETAPRGRTAPS
jgi:hypothetical protein